MKLYFWTFSSALLILLIVYLSFFSFTLSEGESFFEHQDKLAHFLLYSFLTFTLIRSFKSEIDFRNPIIMASITAFLFGAFIEILQPVLTDYRQGSFLDALFNSFGILFTLFLVTFKKNIFFGARN